MRGLLRKKRSFHRKDAKTQSFCGYYFSSPLRLCGVLLIFALTPLAAFSQYTNSWINYSQPYYKFPILQDGIYRITYDALVNSGIPVSDFANNPENIQMFGRGKELYIYVVDGGDGSFDTGDYVEFYAQRNDGYFDREAYDSPVSHGNPYYSLFNDTAFYFFSWGSAGLRFQNSTDIDITGITPADYFYKENTVYYMNGSDNLIQGINYFGGQRYSIIDYSTSPEYTAGEGYFSTAFGVGGYNVSPINTPSVYYGGPLSSVRANLIGISDGDHHMRIGIYTYYTDTTFSGYNVKRYNISFPTTGNVNVLNNNITNVGFSHYDPNPSSSTAAVAYVTLRYPHTMNLNNVTSYSKMFVLDNTNQFQSKTLLNLIGFNLQGTTGRLYDLSNHRRITLFPNGGANSALVPDDGNEQYKECYLTTDAQIAANNISVLKPCGTNGDGYFLDITNYIIPPNFYIITHKSLWSEGQNYKLYRSQSGYNAELFDIDELYDQFAHGIRKNPMAIRHFADYAYHNWGPDSTQHLLLYGKGIYPHQCRNNASNYANCLIPTFGYPPCDMLITAGLGGNLYEPAIPVGRVAARTPDQAQHYLDKVVEYEGVEPAEWRKRVLHFCGGADGPQNDLLCYYLDVFKEIIEDSLYGGYVQKFMKSSSLPIDISVADSVRDLINNGVSLMTFFGHASGGGFDVNLDNVETYNNESRYPFIFGNSCLSGDIHNVPGLSLSMSEPWVLTDSKGAIGFLASSGIGLTSALAIYGDSLYSNLSYKRYHYTIGNVMKQTVADIQAPGNYLLNFTAMQNTLHGDPGIKINTQPLPDLAISEPNVYFTNPDACCTPINLTTELDSFDVNIIINNFGRTYGDTLTLYVARTFPGNISGGFVAKRFAPVFFKDTVSVRFALNQIYGIGINQLYIHVDDGPSPVIDELSEQNNFINNMNFVVQSPDIIPVYPYKFAIMGEQGITLKASTGDPFAASKTYRLELDTTDRFNSPSLQYTTITQGGGVVNWTPTLLANMPDSTVYFWRASLDPTIYPTTYRWRESSFQYITGKYGWGQAHFFQFKPSDTTGYEGNNYSFMQHNRPFRKFDFVNTPKTVSAHNIGHPSTLDEAYPISWKLDLAVQDYLACGGNTIFSPQVIVAVIDNNTLEPWGTPGIDPETQQQMYMQNTFGQLNSSIGSCGRNRPWKIFLWQQAGSMPAFENFLNTVVSDSFYILIYNWIPNETVYYNGNTYSTQGTFTPWSTTTLNSFHALGFNEIDNINLHYPWAFFCQKGDLASAISVIGDNPHSVIDINGLINGTFNKGTITTPLIGPSAGWNWMYWDRHPSEIPTDDTMNVTIIGVHQNGTEEELLSDYLIYPSTNPDSLALPGIINSVDFPYMKLQAFTQDDTTRTPVQLERWQILYDQVPEAALNPNIGFEFLSPEVDQFQDILFKTAIENIGDYDMDSLLVHYWIQKTNNDTVNIPYPRQAPLLIDDVLIDQVTVPTSDLLGGNKLWVEVNPYDSNGIPDQLEQYHFNNIGFVQFSVNGDRINPILDVTFDGIHILDGDIVSAKPHIVMGLDDENQYLIMDSQADTAHIHVVVTKPDGSNEVIHFIPGLLDFYPASAPENKATIKFSPTFTMDGIYKLNVQGSDKSNNNSGSFQYNISFEVINRSTITDILNYPNPFSTSTRFVFVLTGSVIPDYFRIQIMTITGKVVREITTDELGPINIGRNITQFAWNGKDEYGDQLANGVYLYTATAYIGGQDIEHRGSGADKFIKKNFGKMYLMR